MRSVQILSSNKFWFKIPLRRTVLEKLQSVLPPIGEYFQSYEFFRSKRRGCGRWGGVGMFLVLKICVVNVRCGNLFPFPVWHLSVKFALKTLWLRETVLVQYNVVWDFDLIPIVWHKILINYINIQYTNIQIQTHTKYSSTCWSWTHWEHSLVRVSGLLPVHTSPPKQQSCFQFKEEEKRYVSKEAKIGT